MDWAASAASPCGQPWTPPSGRLGYFLGGPLLDRLGFQVSLWTMAGLLAWVLAGVVGAFGFAFAVNSSAANRAKGWRAALNQGTNLTLLPAGAASNGIASSTDQAH